MYLWPYNCYNINRNDFALYKEVIFSFKSVLNLLKNQITNATMIVLNKVGLVNEK